jgi:ribose 5-phosphate isomerase A
MNQDDQKRAVAKAAFDYVKSRLRSDSVIGVGTGSTANFFIDELARIKQRIKGAVASSEATAARLRGHGIEVFDLNDVPAIAVYVDGADEITATGAMIKGGGAALTREKIVADLADRFVCIADESKRVAVLGRFPLPVEVIPMAAAQIARRFAAMGARAVLRAGVVTDNGCQIIDVHGLQITDPLAMECDINQWPGVVTVGIFARHKAGVCLFGTPRGVETVRYDKDS